MINTRDQLANLFKELEYTSGAEIGVDRGLFSESICRSNPGVKLYCVDPWRLYKGLTDFDNQKVLDDNYEETVKRLAPYNCMIIRKTSMEAIKLFEPRSLDFVYIDANHVFEYALEDIYGWGKIVRKGGIVSGHDYRTSETSHGNWAVSKAVNQYVKEYNKELFLLNKWGKSSWYFYE